MKNKRRGTLGLILIVSVTLYVGYVLCRQQMALVSYQKQKDLYSTMIQKEEITTQELLKKEQLYKTDYFVEKTAREKLGMVYAGEKIFKDISR